MIIAIILFLSLDKQVATSIDSNPAKTELSSNGDEGKELADDSTIVEISHSSTSAKQILNSNDAVNEIVNNSTTGNVDGMEVPDDVHINIDANANNTSSSEALNRDSSDVGVTTTDNISESSEVYML